MVHGAQRKSNFAQANNLPTRETERSEKKAPDPIWKNIKSISTLPFGVLLAGIELGAFGVRSAVQRSVNNPNNDVLSTLSLI